MDRRKIIKIVGFIIILIVLILITIDFKKIITEDETIKEMDVIKNDTDNGQNDFEELPKDNPEILKNKKRVRFSIANFHAVFIKDDDSLWGYGDGFYEQLHRSSRRIRDSAPIKIKDNVYSAFAVNYSTYITTNDGELLVYGDFSKGDDYFEDMKYAAYRDVHYVNWGYNIMDDVIYFTKVGDTIHYIKKDNSLWRKSILSFPTGRLTKEELKELEKDYIIEPEKIMEDVSYITSSYGCVLIVKTDNSLWAWVMSEDNLPEKIMDNIIDVSSGSKLTMVVDNNNTLYVWEYNPDKESNSGTLIKGPPSFTLEDITSVYSDRYSNMVIKKDNSLWIWGTEPLALGLGEDVDLDEASKPVKLMDDALYVSIHSLAPYYANNIEVSSGVIKTDGSLWVWGRNRFNRLARDAEDSIYTPTKVFDNVFTMEED